MKRALNSTCDLTGRFDFNRDGRVNALDMAVVKRNLNQSIFLQYVPPAISTQALAPAGAGRAADDVLK